MFCLKNKRTFSFVVETRSHVAEEGLKLLTLLPQLPERGLQACITTDTGQKDSQGYVLKNIVIWAVVVHAFDSQHSGGRDR